MYIYNVTINIEDSVHDEWVNWIQKEHIPQMLATGKFTKAKMTRVIIEEEMGGTTYSIQYTTDSKETLEQYYKEDADKLRSESKRFAGKFVAFRTELEVVFEERVFNKQ